MSAPIRQTQFQSSERVVSPSRPLRQVGASILCAALTLAAGCARHYNLTLNNNHVITTASKPKLNKAKDAYVFKDAAGNTQSGPGRKCEAD